MDTTKQNNKLYQYRQDLNAFTSAQLSRTSEQGVSSSNQQNIQGGSSFKCSIPQASQDLHQECTPRGHKQGEESEFYSNFSYMARRARGYINIASETRYIEYMNSTQQLIKQSL